MSILDILLVSVLLVVVIMLLLVRILLDALRLVVETFILERAGLYSCMCLCNVFVGAEAGKCSDGSFNVAIGLGLVKVVILTLIILVLVMFHLVSVLVNVL